MLVSPIDLPVRAAAPALRRESLVQRAVIRDLAHAGSAFVALTAAALATGSIAVIAMLVAVGVGAAPSIGVLVGASRARAPRTADYPAGLARLSSVTLLASAIKAAVAGAAIVLIAIVAGVRGGLDAAPLSPIALAALAWAALPPLAVARALRVQADATGDRVLHAAADRAAGAWRLGVLAAAGFVVGDAIAAVAVGALLVHDGARAAIRAGLALADRLPRRPDGRALDPVLGVVLGELARTPWVTRWDLRLREHGVEIAGEVLVEVPRDLRAHELVLLTERLHRADRRLAGITVAPVRTVARG